MENVETISKNILKNRKLLLAGLIWIFILHFVYTFVLCFYKGTELTTTILFSTLIGILFAYIIYYIVYDRKKMYFSTYLVGKVVYALPMVLYLSVIITNFVRLGTIEIELVCFFFMTLLSWVILFVGNIRINNTKSNTKNKILMGSIIGVVSIVVLVLLTVLDLGTYSDFYRNLKYEKCDDGSLRVVGVYSGLSNQVKIKNSYNNKKVSEIGEGAFEHATFLKKIEVNENIEVIYANAFSGIKEVHIKGAPLLKSNSLNEVKEVYLENKDKSVTFEEGFFKGEKLYVNRNFIDDIRKTDNKLLSSTMPIVNDNEVFVNFITEDEYIKTLVVPKGSKINVVSLKDTLGGSQTLYNDTITYLNDNIYYKERFEKDLKVLPNWYNIENNEVINFDDVINESIQIAPNYEKITKYSIDYHMGELEDIFVSPSRTYVLPLFNSRQREGFEDLVYYHNDEAISVLTSNDNGGLVDVKWQLANPGVTFNNLNTNNQFIETYRNEDFNITALGNHKLTDGITYTYLWEKDLYTNRTDCLTVKTVDASGIYNLTVKAVYEDAYECKYESSYTLPVEVIIQRADYDMKNILLESKSFIYDGSSHSLEITGSLPVGLDGIKVTVSYIGSATNVSEGRQTVTAIFNTSSNNYNIPDSISSTVEITPVLVDEIQWCEDDYTYNGNIQNIEATYLDINHEKINLSIATNYEFKNYREEGYVATATILPNQTNYRLNIPNTKSYFMKKANYDMSVISFTSASFIYDGNTHRPSVIGTLPLGADGIRVEVSYDKDIRNVEDSGAVVTASFTTASINYNTPDTLSATISITPRNVSIIADNLSMIYGDNPAALLGENMFSYENGSLEFIASDNIKLKNSTNATSTSAVGNTYTITLEDLNNNNYNLLAKPGVFTIHPATITNVQVIGCNETYNNTAYEAAISETATTINDQQPIFTYALKEDGEYSPSLTLTNAGNYVVYYRVSSPNHETYTSNFTATISNADYDMTNIALTSKEVTYDGNSHSLEITGSLPIGLDGIAVTVEYEGSATNVSDGKQIVTASFNTTSQNYNIPELLTATIEITPVTISTIDWCIDDFTYTGKVQVITATYKDISNHNIPLNIKVDYEFKDYKEAGYVATASIDSMQTNYKLDTTNVKTYHIKKANYDMSDITFANQQFEYDGDSHKPVIAGTLPTGADGIKVEVAYDKEITNVSESGTIVTANFTSASINYNPISSKTAMVYITPKEITIDWTSATYTYNGTLQSIVASYKTIDNRVVNLPVKTDKTFINAGSYRAEIDGELEDTNYALPSIKSRTFIIGKAKYDMSGIAFNDQSYVYDGLSHRPSIVGNCPTGLDNIQVIVTYTGSATNVLDGKVLVTAEFSTESPNYDTPESLTAYVEILPRTITINWALDNFTYNGTTQIITANYKNVSDNTIALNVVLDKAFINAGTYLATASFKNNETNYVLPEANTKEYHMKKADYDMNSITYDDAVLPYNGLAQQPAITGQLPIGIDGIRVTVSYIGSATNVSDGNVNVTAEFSTESINYKTPDSMSAILQIAPIEVSINWSENIYSYTGEEQIITASYKDINNQSVSLKVSLDKAFINAGDYTAVASFANEETNYKLKLIETSHSYTIAQANNRFIKEYNRTEWTKGTNFNDNEVLSLFGDIEITYYKDSSCTVVYTDGFNEETELGTYYVKVTVVETDNYKGLLEVYSFEVKE